MKNDPGTVMRVLKPFLGLAVLAGCSAADLVGVTTAPTTPPTPSTTPGSPSAPYQTNTSTAPVTSALRVVGVDETGAAGVTTFSVDGSVTHNTGAATINYAPTAFVDSDGADASGVFSDGQTQITSTALQGGYEYVTGINQVSVADPSTRQRFGVAGIATRPVDVPTSGVALYSGQSTILVETTTATMQSAGTSFVRADFSAARVTGTIDDVGGPAAVLQGYAQAPLDRVSFGADISGNTFSGSSATLTRNNVVQDVTGANTCTTVAGAFYGFDSSVGAPDEVGGAGVVQGDAGGAAFLFTAD